ncbi:hypothetical protein Q7P36_000991 [Cladosporium allicinum]
MDPNANSNGQQQPYQYQQQAQQQNPQTAGTQQYGYTQQAYTGQPMVQQNSAQPMNQPPMQRFGALPQAQNLPMQQQPTYQSYPQAMRPAGTPAPVAGNWNQQTQYVPATPNIQAQTSTSSATTTTTTTTTKKFSKLKQAFQGPKEASAALSKPDFLSLMQQPPQQQQQQQQQTSIDFSQLMQAAPPAQPQPQQQQAIDFSSLMQSAPPPPPPPAQQKIDFSQLMQAAPQPSSSSSAQGASSSSNTQTTSTTTTSTTTTSTTTTSTTGGASRQQAATQGAANLRQFDQDVSVKLKRMVGGTCPMGFDFYAVREGYLCGGGNHFVEYAEVEAMLKYNICPRLEPVNQGQFLRAVTPPPGNGDGSGNEPAFWTVEQQVDAGVYPYALLKDPKANPRLNGWGRRRR